MIRNEPEDYSGNLNTRGQSHHTCSVPPFAGQRSSIFLLQNVWLFRYGAEPQAGRHCNRRCHLGGPEVIYGSTEQPGLRRCNRRRRLRREENR